MLKSFVAILKASNLNVEGDSISVKGYTISDLNCLQQLDNQQCVNLYSINNNVVNYSDLSIGEVIDMELSLLHLTKIGYYESLKSFISQNQYELPNKPYYIRDVDCYDNDSNIIVKSYIEIISLIDSIKANAKHNYSEIDIDFSLIIREDKALLLPFIFDEKIVQQFNDENINSIKSVSSVFEEQNSDKKFLFVNELIDFLSPIEEDDRFFYLLSNIQEFVDNSNNAYQYYIRNFSYNKLKTELDNAALDYSKKIQSVINESQTKLIAIPTAFVLAVASMDFSKIDTGKNIGLIFSLFIFSVLIDIFLRNQKSTLGFITNNIETYKNSFRSSNQILQDAFSIVDIELKMQKTRLLIIRYITWGLPIVLSITAMVLYLHQNPEIILNIKQWFSQTFQK